MSDFASVRDEFLEGVARDLQVPRRYLDGPRDDETYIALCGELAPYLDMQIKRTFFRRKSKGFRRHVRMAKAAKRKAAP